MYKASFRKCNSGMVSNSERKFWQYIEFVQMYFTIRHAIGPES